MASKLKARVPSELEIVITSLKYFAVMSKRKYIIIAIIMALTFSKNIMKARADAYKIALRDVSALWQIQSTFVSISIVNSIGLVSNFLTDYIFEKYLIPFSGILAIEVLQNIFNSTDKKVYKLHGASFEYYVSEGGKAMAKISRLIISTLFSKILHFILGYNNITLLDNSKYSIVTKLLILLILFLLSIKFWATRRIARANEINMRLAHHKEKAINENIESMAIIKSYGEEYHSLHKFDRTAYEWEKSNTSLYFFVLSNDLLYRLFSDALIPGLAIVLVYQWDDKTTSRSITSTDISEYMNMAFELVHSVHFVTTVGVDMKQIMALTYDVMSYIKLSQEDLSQKIRIDAFNDNITVQGLTYAIDDKVIFSNIALTINKGDRCAMVGRNGTGKSSIFKLLLGFDDYKGSITLDGIDIQRICMSDYRSLISYVPQDTKLFDESIYYNLAFGNNRPYKDIMEECKRMKIHEIIMRFPQGYNTVIEGGGKNINGGLRQKIFYTRAFLCNTEIYLFDEPTNNLDETSTSFILEYMSDARFSDKTFFVICHDPEIVEKFPKVFKLNERQIELERELC